MPTMMTDRSTTTPRRLQIVGALAVAWIAFAFSFTPLRASTDEWWHLKTGRYIAQHGLPKNDIYTYTTKNFPWFNHEWLAQLAMWRVFQVGSASGYGGMRALILFKAIFITLTLVGFGWLLARRMKEPMWGWFAAAIAVTLARRHFYPRPPFITYFLIALVFWLLIEWRSGRLRGRWLWLFAPIFALWANLHGGWAAGIVFIAAFWADAVWTAGIDWSLGADTRPALRRLGLLTALGFVCVAATLANPYGWRLYDMFTNVMSDPFLKRIIDELRPPDWRFVLALEGVIYTIVAAALRPKTLTGWSLTLFLLVAIHFIIHIRFYAGLQSPDPWQPNPWIVTAIALPAWALLVARRRPAGWVAHFLLGAFFLQQGIHHVRHLPLTALAILPALAWGLDAWLSEQTGRMRIWIPTTLLALSTLILIFLPLPTIHSANGLSDYLTHKVEESYWNRNARLFRGIEADPHEYPREAVDFMVNADLPRPMFNEANISGYLIWRLAPDLLTENGRPIPDRPGYPLFTDNRYDIYGGEFIRDQESVVRGLNDEEARVNNKRWEWRGRKFSSWQSVLDRHGIQTLFLPTGADVNRELARNADWVNVWAESDFTIWVRNTPANQPAISRANRLRQ